MASRTSRWISTWLIREISSRALAIERRTSAFSAGVRSLHFLVRPLIVTLSSLMLTDGLEAIGATGATDAGWATAATVGTGNTGTGISTGAALSADGLRTST